MTGYEIAHYAVTHHYGVATLHKNPTPACGLGDQAADHELNEFDAEAMLITGDVKPCDLCGFRRSDE